MTAARRIVAGEAAAGWAVTGKAMPCRDMASKSMPCAARRAVHGMKATRVEAAVKTTGGAHAAWMEAASARMEAAATCMKASTTYTKASTTRMEASATAAVETAASATMKATATAAVKAAAPTAVKAAAPAPATSVARECLRQAGECEAGNSACEDRNHRQRSLSAGNAHVFLPCNTAVGKAGNAKHCLRNGPV
jgi:hypothetical protein